MKTRGADLRKEMASKRVFCFHIYNFYKQFRGTTPQVTGGEDSWGFWGRPFLVALIHQTLLDTLQTRAILMFEKSVSWEHMKLFSWPGMLEKKCDF